MSRPEQEMFNDTSSGRDKSGLDAKRRKNLAQAAPMDSSSNCSKSRMSIGREFMRSVRENEYQKSSQSSSQSSLILPIVRVYHCSALSVREKGNNFHRTASCVMPGITKLEHSPLERFQMIAGIFTNCSREGSISNHGFEGRVVFTACRKKWIR